jgi:hypothetical protein
MEIKTTYTDRRVERDRCTCSGEKTDKTQNNRETITPTAQQRMVKIPKCLVRLGSANRCYVTMGQSDNFFPHAVWSIPW